MHSLCVLYTLYFVYASLDDSGDRGGSHRIVSLLQKFLPPVQPRQNHSLHINRLCLVRVLLSHYSGSFKGAQLERVGRRSRGNSVSGAR
jgi:hypothetical protein